MSAKPTKLQLEIRGFNNYSTNTVKLDVEKETEDFYFTKPFAPYGIAVTGLVKVERNAGLIQWAKYNGKRRWTGPNEDQYSFYRAMNVYKIDIATNAVVGHNRVIRKLEDGVEDPELR